MFVKPMLAHTYKRKFPSGDWIAEEKLDGHRMIVERFDGNVIAWSRNAIARDLPDHVRRNLLKLPTGVYDGELWAPGIHAWGVTDLDQQEKLRLTLFDVLEFDGYSTLLRHFDERREILERIWTDVTDKFAVFDERDVDAIASTVWEHGGEGLVLKNRQSVYEPGRRTKNWLKVKMTKSSSLTVTGFRSGLLGPCSIVELRDDEGFETTVKCLNNEELDRVHADPEKLIGRRLVIEYQERTPDGCYRHPRWDRWENE